MHPITRAVRSGTGTTMTKRALLAATIVLVSCGARSPLGEDTPAAGLVSGGSLGGPDGGAQPDVGVRALDGGNVANQPQSVRVSHLALGGSYSCAVMNDGTVRCWGDNGFHQLGRTPSTECGGAGTVVAVSPCVKVPTPFVGLGGVANLSLGATHACALSGDGMVRCWGAGDQAQLGSDISDPTPVLVPPPRVTSLGADLDNTCALREDSTVLCWGRDADGQLGHGSSDGFHGATQLSMGHNFTCARMADSTVQCAGLNDEGQLGNGTVSGESAHDIPGVVVGLSRVVQISAGENHACAVLEDGTVACWGAYFDQRFLVASKPVAVDGLTDIAEVAAGAEGYTCARRADGSVSCWGVNLEGELGDGTFMARGRPATIPGLRGVVQLATSWYHSCALTEAGAVYCWGLNAHGEVGDGTTTKRNEPTRIDL